MDKKEKNIPIVGTSAIHTLRNALATLKVKRCILNAREKKGYPARPYYHGNPIIGDIRITPNDRTLFTYSHANCQSTKCEMTFL